ncbi:RNA polymerase sigma factor [Alicyclobacillus tolerans]|uniref:RNA polymerase sigma factor n=1 Tax=Alicyclobacillus tolerans TaxID=90970 RepID=UPI001F25B567|nr:RNA polymerase sigma factor [Alicyclobacillus tolerans]MCF8564629.1 RNA polymerase sigma factor [Alicyclobacillus tolerans]
MSDDRSSKDAIQLLFDTYSDDVYRYARVMLANDADAKDVVQEVFMNTFRSWSGFRNESEPKTWLMSIARHCVFKLCGKRKRESDYVTNYEPPYLRDESEMFETVFVVEESMSKLKDAYRQVIMLRHIEGFSVKETAQILCWSESKVTTTDQRAIHKLREILGRDFEEEVAIRNELKARRS